MSGGPAPSRPAEAGPDPGAAAVAERPVGRVRGTRDWLPDDFARLAEIERQLLDQFGRAGYRPVRTPILEFAELHERKSGAGIVAKLFEVGGGETTEVCLRPELTASLVRAYAEAEEPPPLPFRVSMSGPAFRFQPTGPGRDREFTQVGVELIGAGGAAADAEVIWLADWSLRSIGFGDATIRVGHVGLILELLGRSGLPPAAVSALVESLSAAAAEGQNVRAIEAALERLSGWLGATGDGGAPGQAGGAAGPAAGVERLFRQLVPNVTGRRSGEEIIHRLTRKWTLGHTLADVLGRVREQVHALAALKGPAGEVLERLERDHARHAPDSVAALRDLMEALGHHGVDPGRVELDMGFGRGIGFYTQMIFELVVPTPGGPREVCGGGRYDGLATVLGSPRDARGAGFAFGLERLLEVREARGESRPHRNGDARGYLVSAASGPASDARRAASNLAAAIDLATFLRERINVPIVLSELSFPAAVAQARALGLGQVVTVGPAIEVWNLEQGDVRSVREGELIEQMRARLAVFRGDRP
ncbi:Histidine--tRNA ligase [Aquisphaera giovannonii]|uniref:Histidine--tRNA ligase n=1 Tax=Aquisphaera giovannonii TaxID=406548 RepID=A0A5B9W0Q4_9BACT|nr:HisS family protein [Aquisphaera giovannonii]QEH34148.1 Histidine--tRNA ligase [Aquisphaera giovannonii]